MRLAFSFLLYSLIFSFFASPMSQAKEEHAMRSTFLNAEKQVWQPDSPTYKSLYNQLHFYPLQPYLDQKRLMDKIRLSDAEEISAFLDKYKGTPLDWPLRKKWLNYLAKRKRKALFLKFFKANNDAKLNCTQLIYQLDAGMPENVVLPQATKWWLVGKSQDKACDPLFAKWRAAGYQTKELVWQRVALAADGGKHTLIPYLTKLLPKEERYLATLWHKVRRDPANITRLSRFSKFNDKEAQIFSYGLKRLIWRAPNNAISAYEKGIDKFPLSKADIAEINARFAVALASKNHKKADVWLAKVEEQHLTTNLIQWKLANVLKTGDWQRIQQELLALPESKQSSLQWQYWYAKSVYESGNVEQATSLFESLATNRHYYGFLAASHLGQNVNLQDAPLSFTEQEKQQALALPSAKRALELFHLERYNQARKEWNYWLSKLSDRQKLAAAYIAYENKWFDRPIFTLAKEGYLNDVSLRFPMAYAEDITQYSKKHNIDATWAFAIARRESSFMRDAHSSVGARGLMQIMPATAKQLEKRTISNRYLYNAKNNINLGTKYLRRLLDRNRGNAILATASYNAGPYRVKQWLAKSKPLPADVWIETIPFKETREYVKSVLAYQQIYQLKLPTQAPSPFAALADMEISG